MREIKFRGKRADNNEWIYGYYEKELGGHYILFPLGQRVEVTPESVGEFTGLNDKNSKEIYEGDITKSCFGRHYWIHKVKSLGGQFGNCLFSIELYSNVSMENDETYTYQVTMKCKGNRNYVKHGKDVEVIGNIYENPELTTTTE